MYDLLIKNGKLVTPELVQEGNVAVKDGKSPQSWQLGKNRKRLE